MGNPTAQELDAFVGKNIKDICPCEFWDNGASHCAHFVSHVMKYKFGYTCSQISGKGSSSDTANVRVVEIFRNTRRFGKWVDKPANLQTGLIFVTQGKNVNVKNRTYASAPANHIGIFIGNVVWQYKNRVHHVVKQDPVEFSKHYDYKKLPGFEIFFGEFPL
jgi:hypothetical protein